VLLGERAELVDGGRVLGRVYHRAREPNNLANHVDAFLDPVPGGGLWTVTLEARRVFDGRFHAWIERDDSCPQCQARFRPADSWSAFTTGTIANGYLPLVVGAYDGHHPARPPAPFSSVGPTRDGRDKPDVSAPGVGVLAARSTPLGGDPYAGLLVRKSGTSMATPHVTGAVALCLELGGRSLDAATIRQLVLDSCEPVPATDPPHRLGAGRLDIPRLLAATRLYLLSRPEEHAMDADAQSILQVPDTLYRECLYRPDGDVARSVREWFEVVGRPGDRVEGRRGDVLVEVRLGRSGGRTSVLDDPAELGRAARPLPPGRLLLRPREEPAGVPTGLPSEDEPWSQEDDPAHKWTVEQAQKAWSRIAGRDPILSRAKIRSMANVPSKAVRGGGFNAWTNSATRIFLDVDTSMSDFAVDQILTHEAVHVRQFAQHGAPRTYADMVRDELEAYRGDVSRLDVMRPGPDDENERKDMLKQVRKTVADLEQIQTSCSHKSNDATCKQALIDANLLPAHRDLDELYSPRGPQRNRSAEEWDSVDEDDGDSFAADLLGEVLALDVADAADDAEDDGSSSAEFSEPEHQSIGDLASGTEATAIPYGNPPRPLTFGDVIMLAGDYYETYEQMRDRGRTAEGRAELEYARWRALDLGKKGVPRPGVGKDVVRRVSDRALLLDSRNLSHFSADQMAWRAYSLWHGKAIVDALEAGRTSNDAVWRRALTKEAFGDHFLTDSFSAGHVRTPRGDIRDWYAHRFPDSSDKFVAYMARFLFARLDERQQLPPLLWWVDWVTRSLMRDQIRELGGPAVTVLSLGDLVGLALHDRDNEGLDVVSDVDPDGHPVPGGYHWRAVGDGHLHRSKMGTATKQMAINAVIAGLRDLERVRGVGVRIGTSTVTSPDAPTQIREALGPDGFAARRFVPREDPTSTSNLRLPRPGGAKSPLEWRWGNLGPAAYSAVDTAVKKRIPPELREIAKDMDKWVPTPVGRVYGTPDAVRAFARHLADAGIAALEAAVDARAR
jgi:hypothetical protein